jgi:hypothetical protein
LIYPCNQRATFQLLLQNHWRYGRNGLDVLAFMRSKSRVVAQIFWPDMWWEYLGHVYAVP